jgi:DNA-binding IclR family transcriptional regulator
MAVARNRRGDGGDEPVNVQETRSQQQCRTAPPPATTQPARTNAAGRLLAVLDAFGPRHRALSLSEISRRAGLSLSTAHRLVSELVNWGALERDANGRYSVGLRLLELAALAPRGLELREAAFPYLDELHQRTRGNVHLGVRDGLEVVYVETLRARTGRPISSRIGDRWPMHATGTGLVLLAMAERELQERALRRPLERFTPMTVTDPAELRRLLARVRQSGVAVARGQITLPDLAVAVPVYDPYGGVAAAISVVVEAETAKPKVLAHMLTEAAGAISRKLAPRPALAPGYLGARAGQVLPPQPPVRQRIATAAG